MRLLLVGVVVLALAGCAQPAAIGTQPVTGELTGEWAPVAGSDGDGVFTVLPETGALVFGNGTVMQASGGCGGFVKPQALNENLIVETSAQVKYCIGPTDADTRIGKKLGEVTSALVGTTLYLTGPDFELELERVPAVPVEKLQGTWTFQSARQSDMAMGIENPFTLTFDGSHFTGDCVSGSLDPVSGLSVVTDLVVTGSCADLNPQPLDAVFAKPVVVHLTDYSLDIIDPDTSTHYEFTR